MTVVKINAITVREGSGDELAHRFAARAHSVDAQPGFEGFELLEPQDPTRPWLVITRWADEASFDAWQSSQQFKGGHAQAHPETPDRKPVAIGTELWSYVPAVASS